ncbi:MAG: efflux RND transporter periplasmic adaptor subunit [Chloroflexia bacterium]|nr:efflux RND transporter periplasmic adaptor subunit [Chloroflexia bacterium]
MVGWLKRPLVIGIIVVIVVLVGFFFFRSKSANTAASKANTVKVVRGDLTTVVSGSSNIVAESNVTISFQSAGIVNAVLVKEGDSVKKGQQLATIDARDLQYQVASAEAAYKSAQAKLSQLLEGSGRSSDLKAAQAAVSSAQAQLKSAKEKLDALQHPTADKISAAKLKVQQAETTLQTTRDGNSATKTKAALDLSKASESLIQAQSKFNVASYNWNYVLANDTDPAGGRGKINDMSRNSYRDAYVQAETTLRTAEQNVQAAQVTLDNAKAAESANVAQADSALSDAKLQLATLLNPTAADIAAAIATVQQNESSLEQAKASLDKIITPGTQTDVLIQQSAVTQAEASFNQVKLKLENATLVAPFDGVISTISFVVGQTSNGASVTMIDRDPMHIDVKFGETDIVAIKIGQPADISIDALPDWKNTGKVTRISPVSESSSGVVTYKARIDFNDTDKRVLIGMTAIVDLVTAEQKNVLLIPNSAILPKGAGRIVQVIGNNGGIKEVDITTGLSDGIQTEVLTGLTEGQAIIATPTNTTARSGGFGPP